MKSEADWKTQVCLAGACLAQRCLFGSATAAVDMLWRRTGRFFKNWLDIAVTRAAVNVQWRQTGRALHSGKSVLRLFMSFLTFWI